MKLPLPTHAALAALAAEQEVSVGQIIRVAIDREIRHQAKTMLPAKADARLAAQLQKLRADDFANSKNWQALQYRLDEKGFRLREYGGGLVLVDAAEGIRLCNASDLGFGYSQLLRRFGIPFPRETKKLFTNR